MHRFGGIGRNFLEAVTLEPSLEGGYYPDSPRSRTEQGGRAFQAERTFGKSSKRNQLKLLAPWLLFQRCWGPALWGEQKNRQGWKRA